MTVILHYFSEFAYLPGVLRKNSCLLSHLLMSSCSITVTISHTISRLKHYVRCQQQLFFGALTCTFNNVPNYMMRSNNEGGFSKSWCTIYTAIRITDALLKKMTYNYQLLSSSTWTHSALTLTAWIYFVIQLLFLPRELCYPICGLGSRNSVCPFVRLSHACFVTNPKNLRATFLYHMKGQSF